MCPWRLIAAAAWIVAIAAATPASGHAPPTADAAAGGEFRTVLEAVPTEPGLRVTLHEGRIPAIFVRNDTGVTLEIPGHAGRPALRIGPGGVTVRRDGWVRIGTTPAWAFLETRARVAARLRGSADLGRRTRTVRRWVTPMRLAGRPLVLRGRIEWRPPPSVATPPRCDLAPWCVPPGP